jgi:hypothetical protein
MDLVKVVWMDILTEFERTPVEVAKEAQPALCESIGFLVHMDETKIIVAASRQVVPGCPESVSDFAVIPRGTVVTITTLKE